jgi:hypothetical protein
MRNDTALHGFPKIEGVNVQRFTPDAPASPAPTRAFKLTSTSTIMATEYPPVQWVVPGYLAEGLNVLAGRQKLGKTWLALDWALAKAMGGYAMGSIPVDPGDVLYVDMENGERRIQSRLKTLCPLDRVDLSRLQWATEAIPLNDGFIAALDHWRRSVEKPSLVVIDVLQRIKPPGSPGRTSYENDYQAFSEIQSWATANGIAVLALHHTRKGGADDPLEALSGSNGLSAVADTTLVLDRKSTGLTLYVRGRDVEEKDTALSFNSGLWSVDGEAHEVRRSSERLAISQLLRDADEPLAPSVIASVTGMKSGNVRKLLMTMAIDGDVKKVGYGKYIHPDNVHLEHGNTGNTGNTSKKAKQKQTTKSVPKSYRDDDTDHSWPGRGNRSDILFDDGGK